jgi:hydrogenase maturation protease
LEHRKAAVFIGNSIFGDDRIGLMVGTALRRRLQGAGFDVHILERTGFALLDCLEGYESAFVVDSFPADGRPEGQVVTFSVDDFGSVKSAAPHFAGVPEALRLMRELGMDVPRVSIIGIGVADPYNLGDDISANLHRMIRKITDDVYENVVPHASDEVSG